MSFRTSNKIKQTPGGREVAPGIFVHDDGAVTQIFQSQEDYDLALAQGRVHNSVRCAAGDCEPSTCTCQCHSLAGGVRTSEAPPLPPRPYDSFKPEWQRYTAEVDDKGTPIAPDPYRHLRVKLHSDVYCAQRRCAGCECECHK